MTAVPFIGFTVLALLAIAFVAVPLIRAQDKKIWPLLQAVHQATLEAGAERTLSIIKVSSGAQAGGPRVEDLVRKFRK